MASRTLRVLGDSPDTSPRTRAVRSQAAGPSAPSGPAHDPSAAPRAHRVCGVTPGPGPLPSASPGLARPGASWALACQPGTPPGPLLCAPLCPPYRPRRRSAALGAREPGVARAGPKATHPAPDTRNRIALRAAKSNSNNRETEASTGRSWRPHFLPGEAGQKSRRKAGESNWAGEHAGSAAADRPSRVRVRVRGEAGLPMPHAPAGTRWTRSSCPIRVVSPRLRLRPPGSPYRLPAFPPPGRALPHSPAGRGGAATGTVPDGGRAQSGP